MTLHSIAPILYSYNGKMRDILTNVTWVWRISWWQRQDLTACAKSNNIESMLRVAKKRGLQVLQNFFWDFPPNLSSFPPNLYPWSCKFEITFFKKTSSQPKWCKLCKCYVNSMVISYSNCQKEEKECTWVKFVIYAVFLWFQFCQNLGNFSAKS